MVFTSSYIHGGAWRDPRITAGSFGPSATCLMANAGKLPVGKIVGLASVDYRLGSHPDFPQDPAVVPTHRYRNARHPEHLCDVRAALRFLRAHYGIGAGNSSNSKYVLVGHSCGATIAMQLLMGLTEDKKKESGQKYDDDIVPIPAAVVGLEGIYNFRGLAHRFSPAYDSIFTDPFGEDKNAWDEVSPACFEKWAHTVAKKGSKGQKPTRIVLAWSQDDELVDEEEIKDMARCLEKADVQYISHVDLRGTHDEVWEKGTEIAKLCLEVVGMCTAVEK